MIIDRLTNPFHTRYRLIAIYALLNLTAFSILRGILMISVWGDVGHSFSDVAWIFFTGFLYDIVFNVYFSTFFAILLLVIPNRFYTGKVFRYLTYCFFFVFICGLWFVLTAEWIFFDEYGTRFNFIAVDYLIYSREVVQNILESYPVGICLAAIGIISLTTLYSIRKQLSEALLIKESVSRRLTITAGIVVLALVSYAGMGQSLREVPQNNYVRELASSGPYQFVAAFRNNKLDYSLYRQGNDNDLSGLLKNQVGKNQKLGGLYDISRDITPGREEKRLNVILVSVESLSAKYFERFGNSKKITPFMNQLFKEGLLFTNFYATGTRTDRGLEAITLSVPPTPGRSIVKRPDNADYYSLGKVFQDRGYDVSFLYGGIGFFDNMNAFFSGNGYNIVDQTDYTDDEVTFKNAWGVCDEDLYHKAIQTANRSFEEKKPFFFHIMTTSNHRPYTYPEEKIDIPSGTNRSGAVKYTDYAMRQFLTLAKGQPWFDDTVFVLVADHCANSAGKVGLPIEKYHIPFLIYSPKYIAPGEIDKIASQIDIAPTLLSLLDFRYESRFFGSDILNDDFVERALIGNYQKLGFYKDNELVILSPGQRVEQVLDPEHNDSIIEEIVALTAPVIEAMSWYQGGDYVLRHGLNRFGNTGQRLAERAKAEEAGS
ncbi:MAG: alkaline phosphatase family protein [Desulfobacteraceae bacterium]|nr:MAG: alkaline phosphatase family protein [Desulfobacteraceae bacterium]